MFEPYDLSQIDPEIIEKINKIGCTSFQFKAVRDGNKIYIIPLGEDKPIKVIVESDMEDKLHKDVEEVVRNLEIGAWTI